MAEILKKEEVNALLNGMNEGKIESGAGLTTDDGTYPTYDFTNQDVIVRGRMPALEAIHERFSRLFRTRMSSMLRRVVKVTVI